METRQQCGRCRVEKPTDQFCPSYRGKPGTWCKACFSEYTRLRKRGIKPQPSTHHGVVRVCAQCGSFFEPRFIKDTTAFCSRACKDITKNAARQAAIDAAKPDRECAYCAAPLPRSKRADAKFCSAECNEKAHRQTRNFRRRAGEEAPLRPRKKPLVNLAAIAKRDRYRCGICGDKVDMTLKHPDPGFASLDHVVPLAQGGADLDPANLRLAHLRCNLSRRDVGGGEQLRLIG